MENYDKLFEGEPIFISEQRYSFGVVYFYTDKKGGRCIIAPKWITRSKMGLRIFEIVCKVVVFFRKLKGV